MLYAPMWYMIILEEFYCLVKWILQAIVDNFTLI